MKASLSFESEISFQGSNDSLDGVNEMGSFSNSDEWGIVSNTETEMSDRFPLDVIGYTGSGVLILDGESSTPYDPSDLSFPGTYSLPTEIGSLSEIPDNFRDPWATRKRQLFIVSILVLIVGSGFLYHERNSWRSSAERLEEELHRLEQEKRRVEEEMIRMKSSEKPEWAPKNENPDLITIIDNCWIKAKADVKFGSCGDEAQDSVRDFAKTVWESWEAIWNNTASFDIATMGLMGHALKSAAESFDGSHDSGKDRKKGFDDSSSFVSSFPLAFGEAVAAATKTFSSMLTNVMHSSDEDGNDTNQEFETAKESFAQASETFSEAINGASEAMASEMKELSEDPWTYLTSAVKGASQTTKPETVSMKGLFDAVGAVTSASKEVVSVVVTELMDDPLSYFEYKSEVKND